MADDEEAVAAMFDLSKKKKKKKKKSKKKTGEENVEAVAAEAPAEDSLSAGGESGTSAGGAGGGLVPQTEKDTDQVVADPNYVATPPSYTYDQLLQRVEDFIHSNNPDLIEKRRGRLSFGLSACEELLDHADPLLGSLPIEVGEGLSSIGIEVTPERNAMTTQDSANFLVNITLKANGLAERTKRTPLDIVCVLDNSGSMSGAKLQSLKEAMRYVRSQLIPDDRLSIVTFNHDASVLHGLMKMSDNNRTASEAALDGVQAHGGTAIFSGLSRAEAILQSRQTMNMLSCVFLLTDGKDNSRQQEKEKEKADLARRLKALGQSLYVFGFGNDHDSAQLQALANAAEGPFTFIESDDVVVDAFGGALGGQQGVIGKDLKLTITMAETEGLTVLECVSGRYSSAVSRDMKAVVVSFANIFGGEQRDVLLKLCVPSCESEVAKYDLLHARVSYKTVDDEAREGLWSPSEQVKTISIESMPEDSSTSSSLPSVAPNCSVAVCSVRRVAMLSREDEAQVSVAVDVQKNRNLVTTSIADALRRADSRDLATARSSLTAVLATVQASVSFTAGHPMALAQVDDLNEALEKLRSEQRYFAAGGRHAMCETMATMGAQRCVYSKANKMVSPYQTLTSSAMQSDAKSKRVRAHLEGSGDRNWNKVWPDFQQTCTRMNRSPEHVGKFMMAELGTEGSISRKLIESLLRKYIDEYVKCKSKMCRSFNTLLTRDSVSRLYFVHCQDCGSSRSVADIQAVFHAQTRYAQTRSDRRAARDV